MLPLPIGPVDVDGICEPLGVVGVLLDPVDVVGGVSLPIVPGVPRARIPRAARLLSAGYFFSHTFLSFSFVSVIVLAIATTAFAAGASSIQTGA